MGAASQAWQIEVNADWAEYIKKVDGALVYIAREALARVKEKSPVDTGHFRANWLVSVGSPDGAVIALGGDFSAASIAALEAYPKDSFPPIYVQNNLIYALSLEHGHSKQAPAGMVAVTVAELEALVQGIEI